MEMDERAGVQGGHGVMGGEVAVVWVGAWPPESHDHALQLPEAQQRRPHQPYDETRVLELLKCGMDIGASLYGGEWAH